MSEYIFEIGPLLLGRDDVLVARNTYRPDCRWRDLTVAERDAAMRMMAVMAVPRINWRLIAYGAVVMACLGIALWVTR